MNLGDLRTYVLDRLSISSADTAKVTQITTAINQEYLRLVAEEELNVNFSNIAFTAGTATAALPAAWMRVLYITAGTTTLQPITWQEMAEKQMQTAAGVTAADGPAFYTVMGPSTLYLYPTPTTTSATGALIYYVVRPALLGAPTDTPTSVPDEWHDLLGEMAASRVAMNEEAFDLADRASQAAQAMRERMHGFITRRGGGTASRLTLQFYSS